MGRGRRIWKIVRIVWILAGVTFVAAMWWGMGTSGVPGDTLTSDARVEIVRASDAISFRPRPDDPSQAGLIFFSGAFVEAEAYAPMARRLAEQGHPVVLVRLPFRLAPTEGYQEMAFGTARDTMAASPRPWVIGGHSRGGMMASRFAMMHPAGFAGLALVGTTHPRDFDLSNISPCVPVSKIYGTADGVAPAATVLANREKLPAHTRWVEVAGGNHVQFGYYRYQLMDQTASIDRQAQQEALVQALLELVRQASLGSNQAHPCGPSSPAPSR